jgi:hypothetical protein
MLRVADGYLVGECGRVWSEKTQSWLRPEVMRKGHLRERCSVAGWQARV